MNKESVIIFGSSGFIGTHLSRYLLDNDLVNKVYGVDIKEPVYEHDNFIYLKRDVRESFDLDDKNIKTIYNFAAVHTTPGHKNHEYFETNIKGAENICSYAENKNIKTIVFTSSISPYGPSEKLRKEEDLPQPTTAYGSSKLVAEYIHKNWFMKDKTRKLIILRPGVVFGLGEGGNLTRLYSSLKKRYFIYPGRKDTKKACIYVKDLVRAMHQMAINPESNFELYNMCYSKAPSIETIVKTISEVTGVKNNSPVMPAFMLKTIAGIAFSLSKITKLDVKGIHPERIDKLINSTNISGDRLSKSKYALQYSLKESIEDWYKDCGHEGLF
jgi:nucleoside-diphosphate-sugar epimerase